jgi:hypothetical protein
MIGINAFSVESGNARSATKIFSERVVTVTYEMRGFSSLSDSGYAMAQLFEALRYKLEGRGFDSRMSHWDFAMP